MSDATGNPSTTESNYTYDTYGNSPGMTTTGQPFRYVGMYYDAETGLYADRARVYSPALGRFLQTDPIGYKDDIDLYTYTGDNPTNKIDTSGLYMCTGSSCSAVKTALQDIKTAADNMKEAPARKTPLLVFLIGLEARGLKTELM
jgi:RHS repeat-associated protein